MDNSRHQWDALPESLRREVEARLGAKAERAVSQSGGNTSGVAAVLHLANGVTAFVKAISTADSVAPSYRHEVTIASRLPVNVAAPRFRFSIETDEWVLLCFDAIDGSMPTLPWGDEDLDQVLRAMTELSRRLTPNPIRGVPTIADTLADQFTVWRSLADGGASGDLLATEHLSPTIRAHIDELAELEEEWENESQGNTLVHLDIRADNVVRDGDGKLWFVDWSWPTTAAAWIDVLTFLPTVARSGNELQLLVERHCPQAVDHGDAFLAALAGFWIQQAMAPALPHAPMLRAEQREWGVATLRWLEVRGHDLQLLGADPYL